MRKAKGTVLITALMVLSLVLSACGTSSSKTAPSKANSSTGKPEAANNQPYKIGVLTTLSGPIGFLGADVRDTMQMEVDRINAAGGINGHNLELVVQDDGMNPSQAAEGFTKLVTQDHVLAVTGTVTGLEPALRPIAERDRVPYVMTTSTLPNMRARHDKYTFVIGVNEFVEAAGWLDILKHDHYTRVAGIGENDTMSPVWLSELKKEAGPQGITVDILPDPVDVNAVDVTPQVSKLKELIARDKDQAVVSTVWPNQIPALLKTVKQLGITVPIISYISAADNSLLHMGGNELNGMVEPGLKVVAGSALPDSDPQKSVIVDFTTRYTAKFHRTAGMQSSYSYDAIHIIADALKVSGPDPVRLRDALENTHNYVGVTGTYNWSPTDHEGLSPNCLAIYRIENHEFVYLRSVQ